MKHYASPGFWARFNALPDSVQKLAEKNFELLKANPRHPSLRFKKVGLLWSARIGDHYRVLGTDIENGIYWIWIGTHAEYNRILAP